MGARRRGVRPITIGRQLVSVMDELALNNNGRVPSTYTVAVSPSNLELLGPTLKPLLNELRQAIVHHARNEGYELAGEPFVTCEHDENLGTNLCEVRPTVAAQVSTLVSPPVQASAGPHSLALPHGETIELTANKYTIGRQTSCDVVIDDHNVSRVHAELTMQQGSWYANDRGSTNGTKVNGNLIVEPTKLTSGDTVSLGSVDIRFE